MLSVRSGLTVRVAHDFGEALGDSGSGLVAREEWDALLKSAASDVVFLTWQWQVLWWRHFGAEENCKLHLLVMRDDRGALVGIAPLFITSSPLPPVKEYQRGQLRPEGEGEPVRIVRLVGGIDVADYLDVIAPANMLATVWSAALDYLMEQRAEWDVIDLHSLPAWSSSGETLGLLAEERGWRAQVFPEDVCPVLQMPDDWETYLMSLRKKDRHELRRKVRKLEGRSDVSWRLVRPTDSQAMSDAMHIFLDLHRKSATEKAKFMDERMTAFFLDMADELSGTGWLELAVMDISEQPAAAYFSFNYGKRLYLYNSGYDTKLAKYSAGIALLAYRIHKAILQDLRVFDFLRGDEPYKYDFGAKDTYIYRALLSPGEKA